MSIAIASVPTSAPAQGGFETITYRGAEDVYYPTHADVATISDAAHESYRTTSVDQDANPHQVNDQGQFIT